MQPAMDILARDHNQGVPVWFLGALSMVKLTVEQTGGAFSLIEDVLPPGRDTPYHVHHHDDETFFILEGEATFFSGEKRIHGGPGCTIFLPREIPHGFKAETAAHLDHDDAGRLRPFRCRSRRAGHLAHAAAATRARFSQADDAGGKIRNRYSRAAARVKPSGFLVASVTFGQGHLGKVHFGTSLYEDS